MSDKRDPDFDWKKHYGKRWEELLRPTVLGEFKADYVVRDRLLASCCESCGKIFRMFETKQLLENPSDWSDSTELGYVSGEATEAEAQGVHRWVTVHVCSATCASAVMAGGWKKVRCYKDLADTGAEISVWNRVHVTEWVLAGDELTRIWDARPDRGPPPERPVMGIDLLNGPTNSMKQILDLGAEDWGRLLFALSQGWTFGPLTLARPRDRERPTYTYALWAKRYDAVAATRHEADSNNGWLGRLLDAAGVPKTVVRGET